MQLGNNRVWDYAGDNYVHRLIQNKGDGKLVEVDEGGNMVQEEKIDSITLEVNHSSSKDLFENVYWPCRTSWGLFLLAQSRSWEFFTDLGPAVHH